MRLESITPEDEVVYLIRFRDGGGDDLSTVVIAPHIHDALLTFCQYHTRLPHFEVISIELLCLTAYKVKE